MLENLDSALPLIWALIVALSILVYVVLDGFDLGVGILFGLTGDEGQRRTMMSAVAPVWDGNETWLLVVGTGLFGAFPMVYAIVLPAFYLPLTLLLISLILRGVAFEFRYKTMSMRWVWDWGFFLGSLLAAFVQGAAVGALVDELPVRNGQFVGGPFQWFTPFAVLCGLGLVVGYCLLGAGWLVLKTEGALRDRAYRMLPALLAAVLAFLVIVFVYALVVDLRIMHRWLERPLLYVFPALGGLATLGFIAGLRRHADGVPFLMTVVMFLAAFGTMAASFWPYMIPFTVTIEDAAGPPESLRFMFFGAGLFVIPVIIVYTAAVYWIFRGKVHEDTGHY